MDSSPVPPTASCSAVASGDHTATGEADVSQTKAPSGTLGQTSEPQNRSATSDTSGGEAQADSEKSAETVPSAADSTDASSQSKSPALGKDVQAAESDPKEKPSADSQTGNPECVEMDSDASFIVLEKSCSEDVLTKEPSGTVSAEGGKGANAGSSPPSAKEPGTEADPTKGPEPEKHPGDTAGASAPLVKPESSSPSKSETSRPDQLPMAAGGSEAAPEAGGAVGGKASGGAAALGQGESVYYVKWILFSGNKVPIITQNENGPCPLLAIVNVLLLKGKVRLAPLVEMITSEQLMAHLGECVVESKPKNLDEAHRMNYEQNMQDSMNLMYKLQTGLDVNVRFTGVSDFEYTSECIIFDLLEIGLYHGWMVDPQDQENVKAVGKCSYNQLVEKVIQNKHSAKDQLLQEALIAEQFLDSTASQLTYHGLCELSSTIKEQELCVFFRNNHFNTMYRHNNELFLLVTDQGFLTESNVVWETLSNVDGDCHFVDANFCTYTKPPPSTQPIPTSPYFSGHEQINSDYQVALSLQQQDQQLIAQEAAWGQFQTDFTAPQGSDHELALRLQEEEDRRAAHALQEQRAQQAQGQGQAVAQGQGQDQASGDRRPPREREERRERKESKDCCIL
ncbi:hypothetical protein ACOMHN_051268 [Nucella lapillus]